MPYATYSDLVARFGERELEQLTDHTGVQAPDGTALAQRLADADGLIDGYLAQRYAVPVSPVPAMLRHIACDLVRHALYGTSPPDAVRQAQQDALRMLRDLADGRAALPGAAAAVAGANPAAGGGEVRITAPDRLFGRAALSDFLG